MRCGVHKCVVKHAYSPMLWHCATLRCVVEPPVCPSVLARLTQISTLQITFFDEAEGIFEDRCAPDDFHKPVTSSWVKHEVPWGGVLMKSTNTNVLIESQGT